MALSENNGTGGNVGNWHVRGHSKITAQDNGSATITTTSSIESFGGYWYSGLNIHAGACVNGQWAGVDKTGVNVGANATVELVSKTLKVSKTRNWQSIDCIAGVRVNGYAGGFSQVHVAVDVPPKPSHTVSYNANGGSGAPGSATKWYGEDFYISNQKPTRANHVFQYWATAANGSGTRYNPGQRYLPEANVILYAVWKLATQPPTIQSFTAQRVDADGNPAESGTSVKLEAAWRCDTSGDGANTVQSVKFAVQDANGSWRETSAEASGATGTATVTLSDLSADSSWRFRATVKDKYGTVTSFTTVGPQRFLLDFSAGGRGIGIGVAAPETGVSIYGSPVLINGFDLVPQYYQSDQFLRYNSGFSDYKGGHNISRCYAFRSGYMLVFQIEVSGSFKTGYTDIGRLADEFIPRTAINVNAVYNNSGVGTAFVCGSVADYDFQPGHVYFGHTGSETRNWAAATFVCVTNK